MDKEKNESVEEIVEEQTEDEQTEKAETSQETGQTEEPKTETYAHNEPQPNAINDFFSKIDKKVAGFSIVFLMIGLIGGAGLSRGGPSDHFAGQRSEHRRFGTNRRGQRNRWRNNRYDTYDETDRGQRDRWDRYDDTRSDNNRNNDD